MNTIPKKLHDTNSPPNPSATNLTSMGKDSKDGVARMLTSGVSAGKEFLDLLAFFRRVVGWIGLHRPISNALVE